MRISPSSANMARTMSESSSQAKPDRITEITSGLLYSTARDAGRLRALAMLACLIASAAPSASAETDAPRMDASAEGSIPASFAATRAVLLDVAGFGGWFPSLGEWRVLSRAEDSLRVYGRHAVPWPAEDRDYVVDYRWHDTPEGQFVLEATARADAGPAPEGVVRLDVLRSRWTLTPQGDTTLAHYEVSLIPRGELPRFVESASWRRESWRLIEALAREVARHREP